MTITATEYKGQGQPQFYGARHFDDAATPAAAVFYPGFRPRYIPVTNLTDRIMWEWFEGMTEGHAIKTVAAGTRTLDTASELLPEVTVGQRVSITLAAAVTLQNNGNYDFILYDLEHDPLDVE